MHEWNVPVEVHRGRHDDYCGTVAFVVFFSEGINSILPGRWRCRVVVSTQIIYRKRRRRRWCQCNLHDDLDQHSSSNHEG